MCGQFAITLPPDAMAQLFNAVPSNDLPPGPNYNVCPTNRIATIRHDDGQRRLAPMRWGFLPHWYKTTNGGPLLINARAETIAEKPAFKSAVRDRRCLIPASAFYEWTKGENDARLPWFIHPAPDGPLAGGPLVFAGIWQDWERDGTAHRSCAIVTCAASTQMSRIHHRMPVILAPDAWGKWLGEDGPGAATLMKPAPEDALAFYRVGTAVNSNRAEGAALAEPLDA